MDFYGNKTPNITKFQIRKENKYHQISIRGSNQFFCFGEFSHLVDQNTSSATQNKGFFVGKCAKAARFGGFVFL
jgi:hypothetical protein